MALELHTLDEALELQTLCKALELQILGEALEVPSGLSFLLAGPALLGMKLA